MNGTAMRFLRLGVCLAGLVTLGWVLTVHAARPVHHAISLPTDWSHRHLIFSRPRSPEQAKRVSQDPRYWQQVYRRQQRHVAAPAIAETAFARASAAHAVLVKGPKKNMASMKIHRDWSKSLGAGASAGAGNFPAKFSFDVTNAFCDGAAPPNQPDYVAYSTGLTGSVSQASIVAYDNLYFGCGGATPLGYWAYNTGGQILTSPVVSLDGTQVAFVQTSGIAATLVTLKWKAADGTVALPSTPTLVVNMAACVAAPCMTLTPLVDGLLAPTDDTTSSVFYDYGNDIGWVGGTSGWLHKITGMFKGTPAEVLTGGFPVQVNGGAAISSPVYDGGAGSVYVGDAGGFLYRVNATTGSVTASGQLDFGVGIVEGPVVDSANNFVYVFASADDSGGCSSGADCAAVYQLSTTFAAGDLGTEVTIGDSVPFGNPTNPNPTYVGNFDSAYLDSVDGTGALYVCGNTGSSPTLYQIPIVSGAMPGQSFVVSPLTTTGSNAACSSVTDIPNPNTDGGPSERAFVSVQNDGLPTNCAGAGCIMSFVTTPWIPFNIYVVGEQVLSSKQRVETVMHAGVSAFVQPNWSTSPAATDTDGNPGPNQVVWIDQGSYSAPSTTWAPSHLFNQNKVKILDTNGNVQVLTTNGTSGATPPAWSTVPGLVTNDGTAKWTNVGAVATAALPAAGGTSGIIIDNTLGPIDTTGDSQIYFTTLSDQVCGTSGTGGCAVQASQPGLN